ncbi:MAG: gfo/Idh/MocA family oxidoreductase, partial [bacterium]|nr:gfo/Idh/MocA family oxidoreductase [bacterium]
MERRKFVKAGVTAAGVLLGSRVIPASVTPLARKRYAIVGTGHRATVMWGKDLAERYKDAVEFVGLCDKNPLRVEA